ncbi:MAG: Hsp33 family molecular chaperone HslO [Acholeplasmatales bacterium]|jgi:molecular chaperone Hsp33|nr:Hsp33 family molecular chaperone HslO [Acholeplasmatales bacterium]
MENYLQKAYAFDGTVRIYAAITTQIVQHAQEIHKLWPTSCAALGRCLTIASIMSCTYKAQEHLTIKVCGDGPIGNITMEATDGKVRGFVQNPGVYLSYNNGKLAVGDAVGKNGYIEVIKDLHMRAPFSSSASLVSGEIAEDFTYYFAQSEQIPSSVGLGVLIDPEGKVLSAGGFLLQIMPGCKEETLARLEEHLKQMKSCSTMINEGYSAEEIIAEITENDYQLLETRELTYDCPCNKERFQKGLISLGKEELTSILEEDHKAHITCNFCKKEYTFTEADLMEMLEILNKKA